ncbi:MAG: efflux RND transporter periplasmic adaptor subunit [Gemmatimonadetes bacterium]|nr:efflux RND transporter periplasmic adaptor subunit [Gemmatimonadota bacterium]
MTTSIRPILLFGALLGAAGCKKPSAPPRPPVPVTVATAERNVAPFLITANGIVEPMQTVAVQSQVAGVLTSVRFKEGDDVKAGQILFEIDPVPYRAALAQSKAVLERDRAQYENAKRDADRYASLATKDYVTRSQADQASSNAAALKAVVDADKATVEGAQFSLDQATIRAPVAGKTGSLLVRQGNVVRPGSVTPLVVINQIHPILVRFAVPESQLAQVQLYAKKGDLKAYALAGGAATPRRIEGTLSFVDNGVDTTTGTVTLKARFQNEENLLWPGQFVPAQLELFVQQDAVLVPTPAVQTGQDGTFVFVVDKEGKAQMQPVTAGRQIDDRTVIEKGLSGGEQVVVDGQSRLTVGAKVEVKTIGAPTAEAAVAPGAPKGAVKAKKG